MDYMLTEDDQRRLFYEEFIVELEEAGTNFYRLVCCDSCVDDFKRNFPAIYEANNYAFQCNSIEPEFFWEQSRLRGLINKEIFLDELSMLPCPNCNDSLVDTLLYLYDFSFDFSDELNANINDLSEISLATPFLLLKHPFAQSVEAFIKEKSLGKKADKIINKFFRARKIAGLNDKNDEQEYLFNSQIDKISEGRFNHNGQSVLYLADSIETAYAEVRNANSYVAEIKISQPIKILDIRPNEDFRDDSELNALVFSTAISAEQNRDGWHKPEYVFTRFIADCAKYHGFDAIQYSSTRIRTGFWNLVLLDPNVQLEVGKIVKWPNKKSFTDLD